MKIKIKDKFYNTAKIPQYNRLKNMLKILFKDNPKQAKFHGIVHKGRLGILACGEDKRGIREFIRFYPIDDIHFYFNKHINKLRRTGEKRLMGGKPI